MGGWQTPPFDKALALSLPLEDSCDLLAAACQYCFGLDFCVPLDFLIHFLKVAGSIVPLALAEVVDVRLGGHH